MTETHADFAGRILAEAYWGDNTLADPAWRKAFDTVPRSAFAPDTWYTWDGYGWTARRRADDERAWEQAVHTVDSPFITQVGDDNMPTCSLSAPVLVAAMLGALDLDDGMRVFESGAGCGWTASLMAERVGPAGLVVSVEYDPALAAQAVLNAAAVGAHPVIVAGDGEAGGPGYAPFDRVSATHSVRRIPAAWIEQTRPGGLVCAPVKVAAPSLDAYVRLTVSKDGTAEGPAMFPVDFMASRTVATAAPMGQADDESRESTTGLDLPAIIAANELWPLRLAVPGLTVTGPLVEAGDDVVWLHTPDGSWAVGYVPAGDSWDGAVVEQHGPTDVWTLAESAWASWESVERPAMDEYGLTVLPGGEHRLWCREPGNVVSVLPPLPSPA